MKSVPSEATQLAHLARISDLGGCVTYRTPSRFVESNAWLRNWLGEHFPPDVDYVWLSGPNVSDEALAHLSRLTHLETLELFHPQITDAGLAQLKPLVNLRRLEVVNTQVTDAGMRYIDQRLDTTQTPPTARANRPVASRGCSDNQPYCV